MAPATARVVRSAAVGAFGAALAAAAHVAAGGQTPALVAVALAAVAVAAGAYAAAGGALGAARLLALLLAAQALLHAAFELTATAGTGHAHHGGDAERSARGGVRAGGEGDGGEGDRDERRRLPAGGHVGSGGERGAERADGYGAHHSCGRRRHAGTRV